METKTLAALSESVVASGARLFFDVSPLFDEHWTGIPTVAAGLAGALLAHLPNNISFFYRQDVVATAAVEDALRRESGLYLERDYHRGHAKAGPVPLGSSKVPLVGIYPSVKLERGLFPIECSVYHDISTLILPHYHTMGNVRHHLIGMANDIATNVLNFGVSQATIEDMVNYLGAGRDVTYLAANGHAWPWWYAIQDDNDPVLPGELPYYVVLGTREPRKNLGCLFDALSLFPELLDGRRLFIVGKNGWLEDESLPLRISRLISQDRIRFTGFVDNYQKYRFLKGAEATIYLSLFEGFGLPVLESLSVGTPCIASWSSSMPEVGHGACSYFDPLSPEHLASVIAGLQTSGVKQSAEFTSLCNKICEEHGWATMVQTILSKLLHRI